MKLTYLCKAFHIWLFTDSFVLDDYIAITLSLFLSYISCFFPPPPIVSTRVLITRKDRFLINENNNDNNNNNFA